MKPTLIPVLREKREKRKNVYVGSFYFPKKEELKMYPFYTRKCLSSMSKNV